MKSVTVAEMKMIEHEANQNGVSYATMMENAGLGLSNRITNVINPKSKTILALVGSGNNGGDALVSLSILAKRGWHTCAYLLKPRPDDALLKRLLENGGKWLLASEDPGFHQLSELLAKSDLMIDGILGTGTRLPIKPELAEVMQFVITQVRRPFTFAVDCPSGIDCDTGEAAPEAIPADVTVCMAAIKIGLTKLPAHSLAGLVEVIDIGLPSHLKSWEKINRFVVDQQWVEHIIPERKADSNKGTFGRLMVVAGSLNYTGAAFLAASGAYRIGTGLVQIAAISSLHPALAAALPEAIWLILPQETGIIAPQAAQVIKSNLGKVSALLIGPGLGNEPPTAGFLVKLLEGDKNKTHKSEMGFLPPREQTPSSPVNFPPFTIDADGLRLLAAIPDWPKKIPPLSILTPHTGEMAALTRLSIEEIQKNRFDIALNFAREWGHIVVLKGAFTQIAAPDGNNALIRVATPALARAGTGDVLAGIISGLRAQGLQSFEAALAGAWIHAEAGLLAAKQMGTTSSVLASDVINAIPHILARIGK